MLTANLAKSLGSTLAETLLGSEFLVNPVRQGLIMQIAGFQEGLVKNDLFIVDGLDKIGSWKGYNDTPIDGTQGIAANKPKYIANGMNGLPSVSFTFADKQYFSLPTVQNLADDDITVMVVAKFNDDNIFRPLLAQKLFISTLIKDADNKINLGNFAPADDPVSFEAQVYSFTISGTETPSSTIKLYTNDFLEGTIPITPPSLLTSNANWLIGVDSTELPTSAYMDGLIGEIIIYNRALTDKERIKVLAYLKAKWRLDF